jgi:hypothetical protein
LAACSGKDIRRPGESLGFYAVSGTLQANSCGDAPSPWTFRVELRKETTPTPKLYWAQGDLPISSPLGTDGKASFAAESVHVIRAATAKVAGCTVIRKDTVTLTLDPTGSKFTGALGYAFSPGEGSECEDLSAAGISALPCSVGYALEGTAADAGAAK